MKTGRPKKPLILTDEERKQLESILRSRSLPATIVRRARIILCSADNMANDKIAEKLGVTPYTVGYWRKRFLKDRCAGLHDEPRSGRPRTMKDEEVAVLARVRGQVFTGCCPNTDHVIIEARVRGQVFIFALHEN